MLLSWNFFTGSIDKTSTVAWRCQSAAKYRCNVSPFWVSLYRHATLRIHKYIFWSSPTQLFRWPDDICDDSVPRFVCSLHHGTLFTAIDTSFAHVSFPFDVTWSRSPRSFDSGEQFAVIWNELKRYKKVGFFIVFLSVWLGPIVNVGYPGLLTP